jgi:hypothetical protein
MLSLLPAWKMINGMLTIPLHCPSHLTTSAAGVPGKHQQGNWRTMASIPRLISTLIKTPVSI